MKLEKYSILFSISFLLSSILNCKPTPNYESGFGVENPNLPELKSEEIYEIKNLLNNHIHSFNYLRPEDSGNIENYTSEDAIVRIYPDKGILVNILLDYDISEKYSIGDHFKKEFFYEFYINFQVNGEVNLTTDRVTFFPKKTIQFKYGLIKDSGKWKISLDSYGPFPLPKIVFKTYFLNNKRPDIAKKFE